MTTEEKVALYTSFKGDSGNWLSLHHQHFTQFVTIILAILAASLGVAYQIRDPWLLFSLALGPSINVLFCTMAMRVCDRFYQRFLEHEAIAMKLFGLIDFKASTPPVGHAFFPQSAAFLPERWLANSGEYRTISSFVEDFMSRGVNRLIRRTFYILLALNVLVAIFIVSVGISLLFNKGEPIKKGEVMANLTQTPLLTVDLVFFHNDSVLLIRRLREPFKGSYALPGGFVEVGETVEDACKRESLEETGLAVHSLQLVGVYSDPGRDPRRHTVSVAFIGQADLKTLQAGDDASAVELVKDWRKVPIAFDHGKIIADAWNLLHGSV